MSKKRKSPRPVEKKTVGKSTLLAGPLRMLMPGLPVLLLLLLAILLFSPVLFSSSDLIMSQFGTDLTTEFIHSRSFGFSEIRNGNFPLWNPHIFSGLPYFSQPQSALLYPPNAVYLFLPLAMAINVSIALNLFLGGAFFFWWMRKRGLHPGAGLFSGMLFMLCGAQYLHVYAGHLSNLCSMIWAPLIFLAIDELVDRVHGKAIFIGAGAITMQVLAGHPQYAYYTAIAAGLYAGLHLPGSGNKKNIIAGYVGMYTAAACLSAVQLLPALAANPESIRDKLQIAFASEYSFPPENIITLVAPHFFGNEADGNYWGRYNIWEVSIFIGAAGFVCALVGVRYGNSRNNKILGILIAIILLLAIGSHTPLYTLLFHIVPGYDKFRGTSKFIFQMSLLLLVLAATGFDHLVRRRAVSSRFIIAGAGFGIGLAVLSLGISLSSRSQEPQSLWRLFITALNGGTEIASDLVRQSFTQQGFVQKSGSTASHELMLAAGKIMLISLLLFIMSGRKKFSRAVPCLIALVAALEMFVFARSYYRTFDLKDLYDPAVRKIHMDAVRNHQRVASNYMPNIAMLFGSYDAGGKDPIMLRRYSNFMHFLRDLNPRNQSLRDLKNDNPLFNLYKMLRCRYSIFRSDQGAITVSRFIETMPQCALMYQYQVFERIDELTRAMAGKDFDAAKTVLLESRPHPAILRSGDRDFVRVLDRSTDHLTIEAFVEQAAMLLVTDAYASGWRIASLSDSTRREYSILPANYIMRAVPLEAGHHRFRMEYRPIAFTLGKWLSLLSLGLYAGIGVYWYRRGGTMA